MNFIVQLTERYEFEADSMEEAIDRFEENAEDMESVLEDAVIVCEETGEEESLRFDCDEDE